MGAYRKTLRLIALAVLATIFGMALSPAVDGAAMGIGRWIALAGSGVATAVLLLVLVRDARTPNL